MNYSDLNLNMRELDAPAELVADVQRMWGFYAAQSYFDESLGAKNLMTYVNSRLHSARAAAEERIEASITWLASAARALDAIGLTPESRMNAIANAKRRQSGGTSNA